MAKRGRPRKNPPADTPSKVGSAPTPDEPKRITASAFGKLMRDLKAADADRVEAAGLMGAWVKEGVDKHNVNKKALGWYRAADRMSPTKLRDMLDQFDWYRKLGELDTRAGGQKEMFDAKERGTVSSFAEQVARTNATRLNGSGGNAATQGAKIKRGPSKRRKRAPTPAEIKEIADRAEQ